MGIVSLYCLQFISIIKLIKKNMDEKQSSWLVPVAIIVCILLIGGAVYFKDETRNNSDTSSTIPAELSQILKPATEINLKSFRQVDSSDKIRGSAQAPIKIVVYTDLECPACKYYHQQLKGLEESYVKTGKLAIVVRNFPLDSLHAKSRQEHLATECVAGIGGQDKYWQFFDTIFEITSSNDGLDLTKLAETAKALGLDDKDYQACMETKKYAADIEADVQEALKMGAKGTPFSVLVADDINVPIYGAYPAESLAAAINLLLASPTEEVKTVVTETVSTSTATTTKK